METLKLIDQIINIGIITEKEISLLKRRLNNGEKINLDYFGDNGMNLTDEQTKKGLSWLMSQYKTPAGKEKELSPFGYREVAILEAKDVKIYFDGFYNDRNYHYPLYSVSGAEMSFQYYISGGKINIIG